MMEDTPLGLVGLDAQAEAVYRHLLVRGGGTVDNIVAAFGVSFEHALALLEGLHHSGLVSRRSSGEFLTVDPRHALRTLVESRERQLAAVRDTAGRLGEIFDDARRSSTADSATRTISRPEEVGDCYYRLKQAARSEICAMDRPPFLLAPNGPLDEAAVRRGVRVRVVYAAASFDAESGWQALGSLVSRGEEARVAPTLPIKLAMADRSAAMVSLSLSADSNECLYTEAPPLLQALTELFEHYWATAPSLSGGPGSESLPSPGPSTQGDQTRKPTNEERNLLALFAAGVKDDAIARQFGVSTRTLRRRIQDLYTELGTTNRFGAGVAAARRNWV
ncbi:LuxR family transcriptional regulator [Streptomyces chiangmaiensis]|uniref:LuxR family transcriptional regulator n=1 Tax=Streptomyces chiangmaiensis TaxID=766497 RepID=A0ABU7FMQ3_9ACTN|nr:LuxR family transcriptional regulator [Streptomyces chiangmaiensis]MED7825098.1 LuxR family transcriptional regulator [Streptomyces chiangmaiensis]